MAEIIQKIVDQSELILKGKQEQVKLVLCNILSRGHTLLEDSPGVGKTTLVKYIGQSLGLQISRIQFTNDLLPADILGTNIFNKEQNSFEFHQGPIFGELILADELNRAPPKTQSALLQVMEERTISVESHTHKLPDYYTVIATQNPNLQVGTFTLPESQLDRFSMKLKMGYPDKESTIELLKSESSTQKLASINTILSHQELTRIQKEAHAITIKDSVLELIYNLLELSRTHSDVVSLSNRCGLDMVSTAKAWAYIQKRDYVIPDDIIHLFPYIAGHRMIHPEQSDIDYEHKIARELIEKL